MPTNIYFIRHGKPHNPKEIFYGRLPRIRLTKEGRHQASEVGKKLKGKGITKIYSSPMLRAQQTAKEISNAVGIESITLSKRIIEIYSHLQGTPISEMLKTSWDTYSSEIRIEGDESIDDVLARLITFCCVVERRHPEENIVAVSHGDPLMMLKAHTNGLPVDLKRLRPGPEDYISYCGIVGVKVENGKLSPLS